jgi:cadmium resistance protein CadD (predicted permease)
MQGLNSLFTGLTVFVATNLDDLLILLLLFSQVEQTGLQRREILLGQYLGFGLLVLASLPGFLGSLILPPAWIGLLGTVPLILGLERLLGQPEEQSTAVPVPAASVWGGILSPQAFGVAALTVANGSDNMRFAKSGVDPRHVLFAGWRLVLRF